MLTTMTPCIRNVRVAVSSLSAASLVTAQLPLSNQDCTLQCRDLLPVTGEALCSPASCITSLCFTYLRIIFKGPHSGDQSASDVGAWAEDGKLACVRLLHSLGAGVNTRPASQPPEAQDFGRGNGTYLQPSPSSSGIIQWVVTR